MNEEQQQEIRELCQPLMDAAEEYVKAIVIYGSATRKDRVEGSDIDILVIVDDTKKGFDKQAFKRAKDALDEVKAAAPEEMDLHFQPPKPLSQWWDLLISGEPWAVTSMEDAQALYDPSDYVRLTQKLLREGAMHGTSERAQRLLKRARKKVRKMRQMLLEDVTAELLKAMTEAAQAVLMYYGHPPPSPDDVGEELRKNFVEGEELLSPRAVEDYREFYEITERVDHGELTTFSGRELDKYLNQAMAFIKAMAALFDKLETEKQESIITESHEEAIEVCREALEEHGVDVPVDDEAVLKRFKEEFVDAGRVSEGYWELVMEIEEKKDLMDEGKLGEMSEEEIYSSRVNLREFETALTNILEHDELPDMLEEADGDAEGPLEAVQDYCDALLDEYEDVIKAVWLLSREDIKETHGVTVVILYNDLDASEVHSKVALRKEAQRLSEETRKNRGLDVHPTFYDLTDYWNLVRHGSPVTFSEIREGIPVYDPGGFFLPLKKLLSQGKIPGTKEAMRSLIGKAPRRVIKVKKTYKAQIVEQLYNAVVDAGQAALIVNGVAPPVQKKLPGALRTHLVEDGLMTERDAQRCEDVITFWKDFEHGDIDEIEGDDIDRLMDDTVTFIEDAEEILEATD